MSGTHCRYYWAAWGALPLLAGLMLLSVAKGSVPLSLTQVLGALRLLDVPVSEMIGRIVIDLRVPRTLLAVLAGAVLAIVGGLLQTTTRNDLADPFLFGLSSGASAGAVLVITRFGERLGALTLPVSAFVGGICSAVAVMLLFHFKKQRGAEHLVICGLAISFLFGALTSYLIFSGDQRAASSVLFWSLGGSVWRAGIICPTPCSVCCFSAHSYSCAGAPWMAYWPVSRPRSRWASTLPACAWRCFSAAR